MQGWRRPTGSAPQRVYWMRRLLVLFVLALVIGLVVWGVTALVGRRSTQDPSATSTPAVPAASESRAPLATPSAIQIAPVGPPKACDPKRLTLSVAGPASTKAADKTEFTLSVRNDAGKACILTVNKDTASVVVSSGNDTIWSSAHCFATVGDKQATPEPGKPLEWKITWDTKRSTGTCDLVPAPLGAGTYVVAFSMPGATPHKHVFQLT